MRILFDGMLRSAVERMFPIWKEMGHEIVDTNPDVQLSSIKIRQDWRVPIVLRLDGVIYDKATDWQAENTNIDKSYRQANAVIYQSETCRKFANKYFGACPSNEYVVFNGIDNEQWFRKSHNDDEINIVSCANWRRWKRLPEIIKIFDHFKYWFPQANLYIIGEMRRGAEIIKAPKVFYTGSLTENEMITLYKTMDLYLHLAKNDSCPNTVVEAIGAGIPVITTNACGGASELAALAGGYIADSDYQSISPHALYKDEWNHLSGKTILKLLFCMTNALDKPEPKFPNELNIRYVAKRYIEIMESVR